MSTRELFGDDDSSSDEDEVSPPEKDLEQASDSQQEKEADNKSGDVKPTESSGASQGEKKSDQPKQRIFDDDSDDDDDDNQFDDKGSIVGLSSSALALAGDKVGQQHQQHDDRETDGDAAHKKKTLKPMDQRRLVVQESKRPNADSVSLHVTKLPNLVGIQIEAFDPSTYSARNEEDEFGGAVHNLVRWRYKKEEDKSGNLERDSTGNLIRESNSRLVQWSDGSWTMHVGTESFEVDTLDQSSKLGGTGSNTASNGFAGLNGYLYLSQKATYHEEKKNDEDGEENDGGEPAGTVLECMGAISSRLTARPSSLQSEAHKSLTVAVRQKTIKKARIAEFVTQEDPEKAKAARIKVKDDLEKAAGRKRNAGGGPGFHSGTRRPRMSRDYLEGDDDDYDTTNISAMKRRAVGGDEDMDDYGVDSEDDYGVDEDDEDDTFNQRRPKKKAKAVSTKKSVKQMVEESEEDDFIVGDDEDDDEEVAPIVKASRKRPQLAVLDDDDSD